MTRADKVGDPTRSGQPDAALAGSLIGIGSSSTSGGTAGGQNQIVLNPLGSNGLTQAETTGDPPAANATNTGTSGNQPTSVDQNASSELTPDEIDKQEQERILESEIHRQVPPPPKKKPDQK
jgi:hypothetical protein